MNNEEKKEYLNLKIAYESTHSISELERKNFVISQTPKELFKYREFDQHTFDIIDNEYGYLTPAGLLNDPFDCLTDNDINRFFDNDSSKITDEMIECIVDIIYSHPISEGIDKDKMQSLFREDKVNGEIDTNILIKKIGVFDTLPLQQKDFLLNMIINIQKNISTFKGIESFKELYLKMLHSQEEIGICSLTTRVDNKSMWSHYSNRYKGCCINYDIPMRKDIIQQLYPVIYSQDFENGIIKSIVQFGIEIIIRSISNGKVKTEMGCINELLCTKDSSWANEDEWRLIGKAGTKVPLKVKSVYLGYDVSKENEQKLIEYAIRKKFSLFKMVKPNGSQKISFYKIEI